jgi:hypothetical protein
MLSPCLVSAGAGLVGFLWRSAGTFVSTSVVNDTNIHHTTVQNEDGTEVACAAVVRSAPSARRAGQRAQG